MSRAATGALIGLAFGAALLLLTRHVLARRAPALLSRIGPYVGSLRPAVPASAPTGRPVLGAHGLVPTWRRDDATLERRLARAGLPIDPTAHRLDQLSRAVIGGCTGAAVGTALALRGSATLGVVVLCVIGAVAGALTCEVALSRRIAHRQSAVESALPTLADLVALAVTSGAGPVAALDRAASSMSGPLSDEIGLAIATINSGVPAEVALRHLSARTGVVPLGRLVDALLLSAERGSPLAEVARAQAADIRADERRRLLELAGRKDVLMLVPIVFLVLPSVVLVAAFPGVSALRLVVP